MNTGNQPKRGQGPHQETVHKSNGVTMVTCFAILWTVCCLCLLLQSFLQGSHSYLPQEIMDAKQVEHLVGTAASRTIYAAFSFSTRTVRDEIQDSSALDAQPQPAAMAVQVPMDTCLIRQDEKYTPATAQRLLDLGCTEAGALDGGGSTAMCVKGMGQTGTDVVNYPSKARTFKHDEERRVITHIHILDSQN